MNDPRSKLLKSTLGILRSQKKRKIEKKSEFETIFCKIETKTFSSRYFKIFSTSKETTL